MSFLTPTGPGKLSWKELEPILPAVAALNRTAMEIALKFEVHACTDITGFGILGHSLEMARASSVRIDLEFRALPFYPNSLEMYRKGETTGSNNTNLALVRDFLDISARISEEQHKLLFHPQTSGGLLLSVPESQAEALLNELRGAGVNSATMVGKVLGSLAPGIGLV